MQNPAEIDPKLLAPYIERLRGALMVGLGWDQALIAINVPANMFDALEANPELIQIRRQVSAILELELLELHRIARKIAAAKGQGRPIEWMLAQNNPSKYAPQSNNLPINPTLVKDDL